MCNEFINSLSNIVISGIGKKDHNLALVKHYNSLSLTKESFSQVSEEYPDLLITCHSMTTEHFSNAYEPFLTLICQLYEQNFTCSMDEFLEESDVYLLHRPILRSYMETGICKRREDIILDEVEYETQQMNASILSMLITATKNTKVLLVLDGIQLASASTISLIAALKNKHNPQNIGIIGVYNEAIPPSSYSREEWNSLLSYCMDNDKILEAQISTQTISLQAPLDFSFDSKLLDQYLHDINNMIALLDLKQAQHYLSRIDKIIHVEEYHVPDSFRLQFLIQYATVSILTYNMSRSLLLCEMIRTISQATKDTMALFTCNYLLSLTHMYNGKLASAEIYSEKCLSIAREQKNNFMIFKSEMLSLMAKMSGWHNIFFCTHDLYVPQAFLESCKRYHYINHLAHIYIYAYDNTPTHFYSKESAQENLTYFNLGIQYIKELGNEYFLLKAYRNNIMIASTNGYFKTSNYFYDICHSIVKDKNPFEEGNIYNGMGYNACAMGNYEEANNYYNKAIQIFLTLGQIDYVGETLYNMAINCIMAEDYKQGADYLALCMKIIKDLKLNSLRVCNISKLFGLQALCSFRLDQFYSCTIFLNNSRQFLSHLIHKNTKDNPYGVIHDYTTCDDDLFMYYFVSGLLCKKNGQSEEALQFLNTAGSCIERSAGNQFFTYCQYSIEKAEILTTLSQHSLGVMELEKCLRFYESMECAPKITLLKNILKGKKVIHKPISLPLTSVSLKEINDSLKQAVILYDNREQKKQLDFLSVWQKLIDWNDKTKDSLVQTSVQAFCSQFNIDRLLFIQYGEENTNLLYDNTGVPFSKEIQQELEEYFKKKRTGLVASKMNADYHDYHQILSLFGENMVCSLIAIPFFTNDTMHGLMIAYILMKDNWHSPINKYMLDHSDLKFYEFLFRQLLTSVGSIDAKEQIIAMNATLRKSAVTDHLTGLLNREGFYENLNRLIRKATLAKESAELSIMYIDLDNFKYYNDHFGHNIGDLLLKKMSMNFVDACGEHGLVSRYGGDEFIILIHSCDRTLLTSIAEKIYDSIKRENAFRSDIESALGTEISIDPTYQLSCSIGIAHSSAVQQEECVAALIRQSDDILYTIKRSSKGTYGFIEI